MLTLSTQTLTWNIPQFTRFNMFSDCVSFRCDLRNAQRTHMMLSGWDVSNVDSAEDAFYGCRRMDSELEPELDF